MSAAIPATRQPVANIFPIRPGEAKQPRRTSNVPMLRDFIMDCAAVAREAKDSSEKVTHQWRRNMDAYMGRSTSGAVKADWQADQQLSRVPLFAERFASTIRGHIDNAERLYDFEDPLDPLSQIEPIVRSFTDYHLSRAGTSKTGMPVSFSIPVGQALRWGAVKVPAMSVTVETGRVRVDAVDPEELLYDPTGRGLWRIREREIDAHQLVRWRLLVDRFGKAIFDRRAIDAALVGGDHRTQYHESVVAQQTGEPKPSGPNRHTVKMTEFLGTVLDRRGQIVAENAVVVVINDSWVIRGPEPNPWWHGQDWIVMNPMIDVPGSIWGRSYVELFENLDSTLQELTNLILDGVNVTAIPSYTYRPHFMENPEDLRNGVRPGDAYAVNRTAPPNAKVLEAMNTGRLSGDVFAIWQQLSRLENDAASQNEISMGQLAPGEKTATEITGTLAGSQQMMLNIATDFEETVLNPVVKLVWLAGLQHLQDDDQELAQAIGFQNFAALVTRKREFFQRRISLKVRAVSGQMRRGVELRSMLDMFGVFTQNALLAQAFLQEFSIARTMEKFVRLFGIDARSIRKTPEEKAEDEARQALTQQLGSAAPGQQQAAQSRQAA